MALYLSEVIAGAIRYQGADAYDIRTATSGSTTTFADTVLATEGKYEEDELVGGTVLVIRTTDNLAPVWEYSKITASTESTFTFGALTTAIGAGDVVMLITPEYPIEILVEHVNDALRDCGDVTHVDTNYSTDGTEREFSFPASMKKIVEIFLLDDDDEDHSIAVSEHQYRIVPSASNVDFSIEFITIPDDGYTFQVVYNGPHESVSVYNSPINEGIHPKLITLMAADKIMEWYGVEEDRRNSANKIQAELDMARKEYPVRKSSPSAGLLVWADPWPSDTEIEVAGP